MAPSPPSILLLIPLFLLTTPSTADEAFIRQQCASIPHVDLCVGTLMADPKSMACKDEACLALTGLHHALQNASDTAAQAHFLLNDVPPPPYFMVLPLQLCVEIYGNMLSYLNKALGEVMSKDYVGAGRTVNYVKRMPRNCEKAFAVHPAPMTDYNQGCEGMVDIAWGLVQSIII